MMQENCATGVGCQWKPWVLAANCANYANYLYNLPCGKPRCPRPLKIETPELAGNIHDLTDEIQSTNRLHLHRLRRQFACVDSTSRHLSLLVSFSARWNHAPVVKVLDPVLGTPCLKKSPRQRFRIPVIGQNIQCDGRSGLPIGRSLQ